MCKNCQERLELIFKRLSDERLKRSVTLGIGAMKYAFEFASCLWPCDLLKYIFPSNICALVFLTTAQSCIWMNLLFVCFEKRTVEWYHFTHVSHLDLFWVRLVLDNISGCSFSLLPPHMKSAGWHAYNFSIYYQASKKIKAPHPSMLVWCCGICYLFV